MRRRHATTHRRAGSADEAIAELLRHAGTQFDAYVIAAFRAELADGREGARSPNVPAVDHRVLSVSAN